MMEQKLQEKHEFQEFVDDIDYASVELSQEDRRILATALMILRYQKVPEDSIVVKKEKLNLLVAQSQRIVIDKDSNFIDYAMYDGDKVLSKAEYRDYIIHETAQRIFHELMMKFSFDGHTVGVWKNDVLELAKKYEVHII